jgi:hypothetical protein
VKNVWTNANLLVKLRNALTHFKPTDQPLGASSAELTKLEKGLVGKFPENQRMVGMGNPFFPDHCLGAGCAAWAVKSARAYADELFDRLGIEPNYQRVEFPAGGALVKLIPESTGKPYPNCK